MMHVGDVMSTLGGMSIIIIIIYKCLYDDACGDIMIRLGDVKYIGVFNINERLLSTCSPTCIMISRCTDPSPPPPPQMY